MARPLRVEYLVAMAVRFGQERRMPVAWIAHRLGTGSLAHVNTLLDPWRRDRKRQSRFRRTDPFLMPLTG